MNEWKKATKRIWKLKSQILTWMLIISIVVTALPVQQATATEFPVQQAITPELLAAAEPSGFQDVRPTDWFYDAAVYAQKNGIFSGTGGGLFSPKGTMTRAMYVTALEIAVNDATGSLTASEVQERITFEDTSDPDFAGITVTGGNGLFTVASAADDGLFTSWTATVFLMLLFEILHKVIG